jgi:ATP-binding cassette subfamily F protein uup
MGELPAQIERLEHLLADPDLYGRDARAFESASQALAAARNELSESEHAWLTLEGRREDLARQAGRSPGD